MCVCVSECAYNLNCVRMCCMCLYLHECACVFVCAYVCLCMSELVLLFNMDVYVLATVITSARLDVEFSRILTFIFIIRRAPKKKSFWQLSTT